MPVKIRLQRKGRRKRPFYHIVIADSRAPRDGKFIEKIGTYNPMTVPATIELDGTAAYQWLLKGAQPTDTVRSILRFKGVLYRKHLQRGVEKGALTQEQADEKFDAWIADKENKTAEERAKTDRQEQEFRAQVSGTPPPPPAPEPTPEAEAPAATTEEEAPAETPTSALDAARAETEGNNAPASPAAAEKATEVAGEAAAEANAAEAAGDALEAAAEGDNSEGATGNIDKEA